MAKSWGIIPISSKRIYNANANQVLSSHDHLFGAYLKNLNMQKNVYLSAKYNVLASESFSTDFLKQAKLNPLNRGHISNVSLIACSSKRHYIDIGNCLFKFNSLVPVSRLKKRNVNNVGDEEHLKRVLVFLCVFLLVRLRSENSLMSLLWFL